MGSIGGLFGVGAVVLCLLLIRKSLFKGGFVTTAATGLAVLFAVSVFAGEGNVLLGVNPLTTSTAMVLGVPGVVGMLLVRLIALL